jgi:hypothetical protein
LKDFKSNLLASITFHRMHIVPTPTMRTPSIRIKCIATTALLIVVAAIATGTYAASVRTVVTGLDNPRGIAIGPGGRILLIEAGMGGTTPSMTGHVTEIFRGDVRRILTLPSTFVLMGEVSGPTSIAVADGLGNMFVTMGGGPSFPFGYLLRANPVRTSYVADMTGFEWAMNPDGVQPPDSNPYGVAVASDGSVLVADAAANDLLQVAGDGTIHTVAVFPPAQNVLFPGIGGPTVQAVPTSIAIGPDGGWYVGELRGFPFATPSHIWRIEPGSREVHCVVGATSGACIDWATGLRHVVSIAFGPDGDLYVSQYGPGPGPPFLPGWSIPGSVVRVDAVTKAISPVYTGLTAPGGIAVDDDGVIYVVDHSTSSGFGALLRIEP